MVLPHGDRWDRERGWGWHTTATNVRSLFPLWCELVGNWRTKPKKRISIWELANDEVLVPVGLPADLAA